MYSIQCSYRYTNSQRQLFSNLCSNFAGNPVNNATQFALGNNTIVWTATDASGNTASCNQAITVVDNQPPTISCPSATTLTVNNAGCTYAGLTGNSVAADNCSSVSISVSPAAPYATGTTVVTYTATDAAGNTAVCTQNVTVVKVPVISSGIVSHVRCRGSNSGVIDLTASGGIGTLTYLWNNGSTNQDIGNLYAGNYTVIL